MLEDESPSQAFTISPSSIVVLDTVVPRPRTRNQRRRAALAFTTSIDIAGGNDDRMNVDLPGALNSGSNVDTVDEPDKQLEQVLSTPSLTIDSGPFSK